jgi:hypothetical protein
VEELSRVLIAALSAAQIPISPVAEISFCRGPAMICDEDGQLTGYVYVNLNTTDYGGFVYQANDADPKSAWGRSLSISPKPVSGPRGNERKDSRITSALPTNPV